MKDDRRRQKGKTRQPITKTSLKGSIPILIEVKASHDTVPQDKNARPEAACRSPARRHHRAHRRVEIPKNVSSPSPFRSIMVRQERSGGCDCQDTPVVLQHLEECLETATMSRKERSRVSSAAASNRRGDGPKPSPPIRFSIPYVQELAMWVSVIIKREKTQQSGNPAR